MRLSKFEIDSIKECAKEIIKEGKIYLFGSRVDDNKKGGDIDLYIELPKKPDFLMKIDFLVCLKNKIGEQKIDIVLYYPKKEKKLIDKIAKKEGILIWSS
ncbi:nucleotidyltransferase domain-containing protein [Nitrosophilus kaiyonis]|uniref:nucleotidyltransferase domain-containing protein n=1 Tax=Nitrosophilus kaiyonis TaxID=2930200 RepID=UPI002493BAB7|nr:nucleotidyltransferase domain-containing protein [Nitrosophilus kaiyonis]